VQETISAKGQKRTCDHSITSLLDSEPMIEVADYEIAKPRRVNIP